MARRRRSPDDEGGEARLQLSRDPGPADGFPGRVLGPARAGRSSPALRPELQEPVRIAARDRERRLRRPKNRRRTNRSRPRRADERSQDRMCGREHLSPDRDLGDAAGRRAPGPPAAHLLPGLRVRPLEALDADPRAGSPAAAAGERNFDPEAQQLFNASRDAQQMFSARCGPRATEPACDHECDVLWPTIISMRNYGNLGAESFVASLAQIPSPPEGDWNHWRSRFVEGSPSLAPSTAAAAGPLSGIVDDSVADIAGREAVDRGRGGPARDRGRKEALPGPSVAEPAHGVSRRILADAGKGRRESPLRTGIQKSVRDSLPARRGKIRRLEERSGQDRPDVRRSDAGAPDRVFGRVSADPDLGSGGGARTARAAAARLLPRFRRGPVEVVDAGHRRGRPSRPWPESGLQARDPRSPFRRRSAA